jgi:bifunctional polynucleotide phosphatase/kinase
MAIYSPEQLRVHEQRHTAAAEEKKWKLRPAACFDFDGTLIRTRSGATFCRNAKDWLWFAPSVPEKLRRLVDGKGEEEGGYRLIVFSNQTVRFKEAVILDALKEAGVAGRADVYIAYDKTLKKPSRVMYDVAFSSSSSSSRHPEGSFFVGDALGRPGDWSDSDRRFAEACGFPWTSPEEFFDPRHSCQLEPERVPPTRPRSQPQPRSQPEMVMMIGAQGSGKTTFAKEIFGSDPRYVILHGDDERHRTDAKFLAAATTVMSALGKSVVIDATNGTPAKRAKFAARARKAGTFSVRCIEMTTPIDDCKRRNAARSPGSRVPAVAYAAFFKGFEPPNTLNEDIDIVERVTHHDCAKKLT